MTWWSASFTHLAGRFTLMVLGLHLATSTLTGPSFIDEPPSRAEFANSTGYRLDCTANGNPLPTTSWVTADGKVATTLMGIRELLPNGSLHFLPFEASSYRHDVHAATYRCITSNVIGRIVSRDIKVRAVVLQNYEIHITYIKRIITGNTACLRCVLPGFIREFMEVTSWLQDNTFNIYPSVKGDGKFHMLPSGELLIRRVNESDRFHSYQCRAVNRLTGTTILSSSRATIAVEDPGVDIPPRAIGQPPVVTVRREQSLVMPCLIEGFPPPSFRWFRQDRHQLRNLPEDDTRIFVIGESLTINHADEIDSGQWVCFANNSAGQQQISVTLMVLSPLNILLQPTGQIVVDVDNRAEMKCQITGGKLTPPPARIWLKDGHPVEAGPTLLIEKVNRDDAGMYQCVARAEDDSIQASVQLRLGAAHPQLQYKFITQTLQPGPPVSLKCIASGNPTPHVTWRLDGYPLPQNERFVIGQYVTIHGDVISHVNISNVKVEDGGIYECTATNRVGEISHSEQIRIYGSPVVRPIPNMTAVEGDPLFMTCPVAGYPIETIQWEKGTRRLPLNRRQHVFPNGTLKIENVQRESDSGEYRCTAINKKGDQASQVFPLVVLVPPRIAPFAFQADLHVGDRAGVQCFVTKGDLPVRLEWRKDGMDPEGDVGIRALDAHVSSLSIESLQPYHAGIYTCLASNAAAVSSHEARLLVNVPPRIGPFSFGELIEGERAQVQCVVQAGDPPLTMNWFKDDRQLPAGLGIQVSKDAYSSTLAISRVDRLHAGQYTCLVEGPAKAVRVSAPLVVRVPPHWVAEPQDVNVTSGETGVFHCQAEGFPEPTVIWRKWIGSTNGDGQNEEYHEIRGRSRGLQLFSNGTLLFRPVLTDHEGTYMCEASNGVGAGLSAVVTLVVHNPPEFEVKSAQASVRRGAKQILQCQARGDQPLTIVWHRQDSAPLPHNRATIEPRPSTDGLLSELHIAAVETRDAGAYICVARNPFGRAERMVYLHVQDSPGRPQELRAVGMASRSVKLVWIQPPNDQSPALQYLLEYRREPPLTDEWRSVSIGTETSAVVTGLEPATRYHFRVLAENEIGTGEASSHISVRTDGEAPAGAPQNVQVIPIAPRQLQVTWSAPPAHLCYGSLLGYYIGFRELGLTRPTGYNFTTVSAFQDISDDESGNSGQFILTNLKTFRNYGVVVQAFNEKGPGPMAIEVTAQTLEGTPSGPPLDVKCSSMGSQSLSLSWQPPSASQQNGVIQGYRIYYENMNEWPPGTASVEAAVRDAHDSMLILEDLQKFGNYSIQVWAYTLAGDGIKSHAIYCLTDEDVPDPPAEVKVVLKSISSLVVSWRPPNKHNGRILGYNIYSRVVIENREKDSSKRKVLVPNQHLEIHDLRLEENYEYWVTAFTRAGEGQSTPVVFATMTSRVPAGIVSFGEPLWIQNRHSIRLPCIVVGMPPPERMWDPLPGGARLLDDGTLVIEQMQRLHQDNYTCTASNVNGISSIMYSLHILGPPNAPNPQVTGTGATWLEISWRQVEHGGSPVRGFLLAYRPSVHDPEGVTNESKGYSLDENKNKGHWNELALPRDKFQHRLEGLSCGRAYQFHLVAYNKVGSSAPGSPLLAQTNGGKPLRPHFSHLLEPGPTNITVHLRAWNDNGCPPLLGFDIQYREMGHKEFLAAGTGVQGRHSYTILGLWPSTDYEIRITALNAAGLTNALYSISTLPLQIETIEPKENEENLIPVNRNSNENNFYSGVGIILPFILLSLAIVAASLGICICWRRKLNAAAEEQQATASFGDAQAMVSLDNKQNLAQREQYYAALEKSIPSSGKCEKVPEFADDISPYATFHVSNQPSDSTVSSAQVHTFVYHEQRVAAMETMQLKSVNPRSGEEYSKLRLTSKSKGDYSSGAGRRDSSTSSRRNPLSSQSMLYAGPGVMTTQLPVDSSTSPEVSPVPERRNPPTHRHRYARRSDDGFLFLSRLEPPSGFSDGIELSEVECDINSSSVVHADGSIGGSKRIKSKHSRRLSNQLQQQNFTIAV